MTFNCLTSILLKKAATPPRPPRLSHRSVGARQDPDVHGYAIGGLTLREEPKHLQTRAKIHRKLGADQHWTGDDTTKSLLPGGNKRGVVEIFSYDKNPKTLGQLGNNLVLVKTKPIG